MWRRASAARTSRVPRAVAVHVNCDECSRAFFANSARKVSSRRMRSSNTSRPIVVEEEPGHAVDDGVAVSRDPGRDCGDTARPCLGDRHPPSFVAGRARQHQGALVEVEQRDVVDPAG